MTTQSTGGDVAWATLTLGSIGGGVGGVIAGMIGIDDSGKVVPGGIVSETKQIMENVHRILKTNGSSMDRVLKCTVMLADIKPARLLLFSPYDDKLFWRRSL